jgi:hypothetical protein
LETVTFVTVMRLFYAHNYVHLMIRPRQFVAAFMILAIMTLFSAPLLACQAAGHRCAMMSHPVKVVVKHACCHEKGNESPAPVKQRCHDDAVVMPAECAASTNCCDMGNAPAVSVVQAEPAKKSTLAILPDPPREPRLFAEGHVDRSTVIPRHPRPVFDLKTDLRI